MDLADTRGVSSKILIIRRRKAANPCAAGDVWRTAVAPINNDSPHSELALTHYFESATAEITNVSTVLPKGKLARIKGELRFVLVNSHEQFAALKERRRGHQATAAASFS